jgi:hypothetical protein
MKKYLIIWAFVGPAAVFFLMSDWQPRTATIRNLGAVAGLRKQMDATLKEIMKTNPQSPAIAREVSLFKETEKVLAELEGREPVIYRIISPAAPQKQK